MSLVFSTDGHIVEPFRLRSERIPPSLRAFGLISEVRDDIPCSLAGAAIARWNAGVRIWSLMEQLGDLGFTAAKPPACTLHH